MAKQRELLGQVAIRKGYVTPRQLEEAIAHQGNGSARRMLGLILLERGFISNEQLIDVLRDIRQITTARWLKAMGGARG